MRKSFKYYLIIWIIVFVLFNLSCFLTPSSIQGKSILEVIKLIQSISGSETIDVNALESFGLSEIAFNKYGGSFWVAYVFIVIAFIGQLICSYIAFNNDSQKFFYRIPLIRISYTYLITTLIIGTICMIIPDLPNWLGILLCLIILVINIITLLKASAAIEYVETKDEQIKSQTSFIKSLTAEAQTLISKTSDENSKEICKKVYEAIRYSDPISNESLNNLEQDIKKDFDTLSNAISNKEGITDIANSLINKINERNKKVKTFK